MLSAGGLIVANWPIDRVNRYSESASKTALPSPTTPEHTSQAFCIKSTWAAKIANSLKAPTQA